MGRIPFSAGPKRLGALLAVGLAASSWAASHPDLHATSERYQQSGGSAATGRSGTAQITARALLSRSGTTDVEITTGQLDSIATAPGELSGVQLKVFDADGSLSSVSNLHDVSSSGAADLALTNLVRGDLLQIQSNVRGIDGARTDVVTVRTPVLRRPDLAVESVTAPGQAYVGVPVNVTAVVSERNGDVGATGDCVLSVNGVEVDRAEGIWVDAGDSVSCAFAHTFSAAGTDTITVSVANVVPGDDDPSDDSASTQIEIIEQTHFDYTASVSRSDMLNVNQTTRTNSTNNGTTTSVSQTATNSQTLSITEQSQFTGTLDRAMPYPLSVQVAEYSDGATNGTASFAKVSNRTYPYGCTSAYDSKTGGSLYVCTQPSPALTRVTWTRYAGSVTYFTATFSSTWWVDDATQQVTPGTTWASNSSSSRTSGGPVWNVGLRYGFDVQLANATDSAHVQPEFDTHQSKVGGSYPQFCRQTVSGSQTVATCTQLSYSGAVTSGSGSGSH